MESIGSPRDSLKADRWDEWANNPTDQKSGIPGPAVQKVCPNDADLIDLVSPDDQAMGGMSLIDAFRLRKSHRSFNEAFLTLEELSFLLWATQGVRMVSKDGTSTLRTVPSGGGRHALETYLLVSRIEGLERGLYRYLPVDHKLCFLRADPDIAEKAKNASRSNAFVGDGAVVFAWTAIPYRAEWRYGVVAHKMIAIDSGHVCQNLYLACTAIGSGTCAVGAYSQTDMDKLLRVDGDDEFTIYVAPVGKIA